ncbi:beta-ketoacyl-ACP synthase III [Propionimicrobium sp. PCR01-08-3]|uniref:beta-ketoacyl-ACP synthase III n=1 Tax=Propionimicrobium sp. PCR01-08-3 TaxID=3052086 RepID=UPI00255C6729|nr:beta-ketoacyl-ACP synthase III [Propionimicrobium sp. PCR01-08-3]WIY83706.1 beta-ketoacyl-ACP synthase III [Propionimicrobium sp. PCR01-08-3]
MSSPIKVSQGATYSRILAVAGARGNRVVDNAEMCTIIDSSDEWIQQRTGIIERRWVDDGQNVLSLAIAAARKAVERSGVPAEQIDGVLVSSVSNTRRFPSLATQVASALGLPNPAAADLSAACAGFCYGISLADSMVRTGSAHHVLVVGVEVLSKQTNYTDRSTAFLFGDGAGAVVIGPSDTPAIGPAVWGSEINTAEIIHSDDFEAGIAGGFEPMIHMDGHSVFRWATSYIVEKTVEVLEASGLRPDQLDVFIPHQANNRITDAMLRRLKLPESVVVSRDIKHMGNASAASIPIAMDALLESGEAKSGDNALVIGFGAGLVFAGQVVVLP